MEVLLKLADALNIEIKDLFDFSHKASSQKELKETLNSLLKVANRGSADDAPVIARARANRNAICSSRFMPLPFLIVCGKSSTGQYYRNLFRKSIGITRDRWKDSEKLMVLLQHRLIFAVQSSILKAKQIAFLSVQREIAYDVA